MTLVLYHRTTIGEAGTFVQRGFVDQEWDFGLQDAATGKNRVVTGVWMSDRPLGKAEGLEGDALLEVTVEADQEELADYELEGMLWDARLWVVPAAFLNKRARSRILKVDPDTSWFHKAWNGDSDSDPER
jgi:hypothetical protein